MRALSEISDLIIPEETFKEYENKIEKLLKKGISEEKSSKGFFLFRKFSK